jgi:transposase
MQYIAFDSHKRYTGVGFILAVVIAWEIGDIHRFGSVEKLAAYAGTVPRVHSSGGKTRHGPVRQDVNRTLKWAYVEAANSTMAHRRYHPDRFVNRLYARIATRRGSGHRRHPAAGAAQRVSAVRTIWVGLATAAISVVYDPR